MICRTMVINYARPDREPKGAYLAVVRPTLQDGYEELGEPRRLDPGELDELADEMGADLAAHKFQGIAG